MSGVRCGGDTPLAGNETCHTVAFHQPHPPACGSPPGHADATRRTPEANHKSHPSPPRRPRSRPLGPPLPSAQDQTGVAACGRNTPTVTPPPPSTPSSPGSLRPPQHRRSDTASPLRLPHPKRHSSSFRVHAPVRSRAFSRTRFPEPFPLPRREPFPLAPVDLILTYPVTATSSHKYPTRWRPGGSVCQSCGRSPPHPRLNSSENLRLGLFPPNRTPSPHAVSILGHQTRSLWKCPATGGNSNVPNPNPHEISYERLRPTHQALIQRAALRS